MNKARLLFLVLCIIIPLAVSLPGLRADQTEPKDLDVPYEPSHPRVVERMLKMAKVGKGDLLYDLGCGDGRIAIAAARKYGARAVCVDISAQRIAEAKEKAKDFGVARKIKFVVGDIFKQDYHKASVVTMYLLTSINKKLRPRLLAQLKPGTRIVSHAFHMSEWKPDLVVEHKKARKKKLYYWVVPAQFKGNWKLKASRFGKEMGRLTISTQTYQKISGHLKLGERSWALLNQEVKGATIQFTTHRNVKGRTVVSAWKGRKKGNRITGNITERDRSGKVLSRRKFIADKIK